MMLARFYHVSCTCRNNIKQGTKLCKMLNPKSKKSWHPTQVFQADALPSVQSLTKVKNEPGKRGLRRVAVLNNMLMKYITDIMSTGTMSMSIVGRGIEISKVKITPDYQTVNVYWVCKGDSSDAETESLLQRVAGPLRHELSILRVMGQVPYIAFLKDRQESFTVDIDRRLAQADFGEDFEPTDPGHLLKTEFTLNMQLSPEMKMKIKQMDEDNPPIDDLIPEMTHNVFGLEHDRMMNRLLAARKKTRDAWSNLGADGSVVSYRSPPEKTIGQDEGKQKQELADFLLKRQIMQNKIYRQLRDSRVDWHQLLSERHEDDSQNDDKHGEFDHRFDEDDDEFYNDLDRVDNETRGNT